MTKYKSLHIWLYSSLRICNVDDVKVIDWIFTWSNVIWQSEWNKYLKQKKQATSHKDGEQNNVALMWRNHKRKNKIDGKITYFSKRERKKGVTGLILGKKLTLNHPSLMDEGEETTVLVTAHKREEGEREREFEYLFLVLFEF